VCIDVERQKFREARGAPREPVIIGETTGTPKPSDGSAARLARKSGVRSAIISDSPQGLPAMEAERVNQIAASLADLRQRTAELRRYL
jgi:hypothetical protein